MEAFQAAIREVVRPGDVVLDMGTGTGILGLLACRAGAKRVYSVDRGPIIELARKICAANGLQDRVVFLKGLSTQIELPEKVDVVIADQLDCAGFEAGLLHYFADAKLRFLKPGGRMIPAIVDFLIAAVQCDAHWRDVAFWNEPQAEFSFAPVYEVATNVAYALPAGAAQLLSAPVTGQIVEFARSIPSRLDIDCRIPIERAGTFHGLLCWFSAQLSETVTLTNAPFSQTRADRRCTFLPVRAPLEVTEGSAFRCTIKAPFSQRLVHWTAEFESNGAALNEGSVRFAHSTFKGSLLCPEELAKTSAACHPTLSAHGQATLSALRMIGEGLSVGAVQAKLRSEHPALFRSEDDCSAFVAEIVRKHTV